jgi:hypothetical protein
MKRLTLAAVAALLLTAGTGCTMWHHPWPGNQRAVDASHSQPFPDCPECMKLDLPPDFHHSMHDKHPRWGRGEGLHDDYHCDCHCNCPQAQRGPLDPAATGLMAAPGMSAAQVAYPYYTSRGPRDFLDPNPPRLGP